MSVFNIDKKAYNYILEEGGEVYLSLGSDSDCCGGQSPGRSPFQIATEAPDDRADKRYKKINYHDITIYLPENVNKNIFKHNRLVLKTAFGGSFNKLVFQ